MGKKKKQKKKSDRPTHVAGIKLPPELREIAAAANQLVKHPIVADVISAGVLAAVAALAENENVRRSAASARDDVEDAADEASRSAARAKVAVKAAAGAMGKRIIDEVKDATGIKISGKPRKSKKVEPEKVH